MTPSKPTYLESLIAAMKDARDLFTNRSKSKREKMVTRAFLRCLGIGFLEGELIVGPDEPVDISFRNARFQIREMLGERRRGHDLHEQLERYSRAGSIDDVTDPWRDSKPISLPEVSRDIAESLSAKADKYGLEACAKLDALLYVNVPNRHLYPLTPMLDPLAVQRLAEQRWRSVSMVFIPFSCVLVTKEGAPTFLMQKAGCIFSEWPHPMGQFDP